MKKLIPSALLLAVAGVAQAQVSVYGLIDASYGRSIQDNLAGLKADFHSGGDDGSGQGNSTTRVGVKASADVGTGVKANVRLESAGITSDGQVGAPGQAFFNRQAWAGFSGSFGEVRLGRQDSLPFQTMIDFDFNGAANMASAFGSAGAAIWGRGRQSRSLQYIAPELMPGLKVQGGFTPEDHAAAPAVGAKANFGFGVTYSAGPLAVAVSGESKRTNASSDFTSVAGRYDFGVAKVMLGYANGGTNQKGINAGVMAPVAGFSVGLNFAKNSDTKSTGLELFANKEIFKNTYAYLDVGRLDDKSSGTSVKGTGYALGVIYVF